MNTAMRVLRPESLTAGAFSGFGDVIQTGETYELINQGSAQQFADLAAIDVATDGGRPRISIYRARRCELPRTIAMLERHPLSSQFFMPLHGEPFMIVVAPAGEVPDASAMRAFVTNGRQGINYHCGVWHHPLIALSDPSEFLVVDRAGDGKNCDEFFFDGEAIVLRPPEPIAC